MSSESGARCIITARTTTEDLIRLDILVHQHAGRASPDGNGCKSIVESMKNKIGERWWIDGILARGPRFFALHFYQSVTLLWYAVPRWPRYAQKNAQPSRFSARTEDRFNATVDKPRIITGPRPFREIFVPRLRPNKTKILFRDMTARVNSMDRSLAMEKKSFAREDRASGLVCDYSISFLWIYYASYQIVFSFDSAGLMRRVPFVPIELL